MRKEKLREVVGTLKVTQLWFLTPRPQQTWLPKHGRQGMSSQVVRSIPWNARVRP